MALNCQRLAASSCQTGENIGAVLRRFLPGFLAAHPHLPARKKRILKRMAVCRSGALGHAIYECSHCGQRESIPLGCGDRHCPCCQAVHSRRWLEHQLRWLLPVPYYHVVFTLPHELHPLLLHNQQTLYKLLFDAAAQSLLDFARTRLEGTPGITAVLHTWGQKLNYHPHLHCILTAGALSEDATQWRRPKQQRYLFPEAAVGALFRGKFMAGLRALAQELRWPGLSALQSIAPLYKKNWRVYLKRPFGGPEQVLAYLANYTHRVAIANSRIREIDEATGKVTITYRDYADGAKIKLLKLSGTEFIRRFSLHLLPPRFTKIRHYGILGNNRKSIAIPTVRLLLHSLATVRLLLALARRPTNAAPVGCTRCHIGQMRLFALWYSARHLPRGTASPRFIVNRRRTLPKRVQGRFASEKHRRLRRSTPFASCRKLSCIADLARLQICKSRLNRGDSNHRCSRRLPLELSLGSGANALLLLQRGPEKTTFP